MGLPFMLLALRAFHQRRKCSSVAPYVAAPGWRAARQSSDPLHPVGDGRVGPARQDGGYLWYRAAARCPAARRAARGYWPASPGQQRGAGGAVRGVRTCRPRARRSRARRRGRRWPARARQAGWRAPCPRGARASRPSSKARRSERAARAMPSRQKRVGQRRWRAIETNGSISCVSASSPVAAVTVRRQAVESVRGPRRATRGSISGLRRLAFTRCAGRGQHGVAGHFAAGAGGRGDGDERQRAARSSGCPAPTTSR